MTPKHDVVFTLEEVAKHDKPDDFYLIVDNKVYDVTNWQRKHPGGSSITMFRGQDATDAVRNFHPDQEKFERYLRVCQVGVLDQPVVVPPLMADFRALQQELRNEGLFEANMTFFVLWLAQVIALEIAAFYVIVSNPSMLGWQFWAGGVLLAIAQIQAGWLQHDLGHLAVFKSRSANQWAHHVTIGLLKGASSWWWKTRHNRHHSKTNILKKDPDIHNEPLFLFGEVMVPKKLGWKHIPYQKYYWWLLGPPVVTTLLFFQQNIKFIVRGRYYIDQFFTVAYFARHMIAFIPVVGFFPFVVLYFFFRLIESHWFTWITSMSHLPMKIMDVDEKQTWVESQLVSTQNMSPGLFNDWFTGHLNYQIEHHLFPLMPRHNYPLVAPRVQALCQKYGIEYRVRSLLGASQDVLDKLSSVAKVFEAHYGRDEKKSR
eukprot:TRINITY_DN2938_c0_g1_i2.p1 TRINITY_DN2938_c0_g1~~TRINITY_DN2938_c0_g1_i2.p1  ORF type:complete len:429 (-),score=104.58 TRINITY_DN2938_c0_g1_i2:311-1597(-)